jgi:hypothetical protein
MPQLKWNQYDFVECLGVVPKVGDYETEYIFEAENDGLRVLINVWPSESIVQISLFRDGSADYVTSFGLAVRGEVRFINDKRGSYLEFVQCVVVPNRFYYFDMHSVFESDKYTDSLDFELRTSPDIQLKFY